MGQIICFREIIAVSQCSFSSALCRGYCAVTSRNTRALKLSFLSEQVQALQRRYTTIEDFRKKKEAAEAEKERAEQCKKSLEEEVEKWIELYNAEKENAKEAER
jgi:uncharacterized Ntn-hydrolase superfamily protein